MYKTQWYLTSEVMPQLLEIMESLFFSLLSRHCFYQMYQQSTRRRSDCTVCVAVARPQEQADCKRKSFPSGLFIIGEWARCLVLAKNVLFRNKHLMWIGLLDDSIFRREAENSECISRCSGPGSALFMCSRCSGFVCCLSHWEWQHTVSYKCKFTESEFHF